MKLESEILKMKSMFKVGDKLISKVNDDNLTQGRDYMIKHIGDDALGNSYKWLDIEDDNYNTCHYKIDNVSLHSTEGSKYYYGYFFYTKSELRDMKLKELGI